MPRKFANLLIVITALSLLVLNSSTQSVFQNLGNGNSSVLAQTYTPHEPIHIDGNADFLEQDAVEGWPGDGSVGNPIIISGYSFAAAEHMLRVENSDLHWEFVDNQLDGISQIWCGIAILSSANGVIKDNFVERAAVSIHVVSVENMTIEGNEARDSTFAGIVIEDGSSNVLVKNNIVYDNADFGIHVGNPFGSATSHNITIIGNTVYDNTPSGIILLEADDCVVEGNVVHDNALNGIVVESGSHHIIDNQVTNCTTGILVSEGNCTITENQVSNVEYALSVGTEHNTISGNSLTNNEKIGLRFFNSYTTDDSGSNNIVTGNLIANNSRWGVQIIMNANANVIEGNYFFNNGETCQASDDGTDNLFDLNYWDDWTSPDANNDSIVDVPYSIEGDAENSDLHPLAIPDKSLPPWFVITTTSTTTGNATETTTSSTGNDMLIDPLILGLGVSIVAVILVIVIVAKKR
jgi:parallel beta-helix repeat protein